MKIVTAIYELNYVDERSGQIYKPFPLLTRTINEIIFDEYEYVIYTDIKTYQKYNFQNIYNKPNVKIKLQELNSEFYNSKLNPVRKNMLSKHELYDRIYTVNNYIEVILNKLKFLIDESKNGENTVWIDSGLFGTSCHDGWRDYMCKICHTKEFLKKINEKINTHGFICLKGNDIQINYLVKENIKNLFNKDIKIIPGGLFGGTTEMINKLLNNYQSIIDSYISHYNDLLSEQEILSILTYNESVKFFEFGDWLDLQKGILEILDQLKINYRTETCYVD